MTRQSQILSYLVKQEKRTGKPAVFNRTVAETKLLKNDFWTSAHNTVMRTARKMASENILKNTGNGEFKLTPKGRKLAS